MLASAAKRWFRRLGRMDALSRLITAATADSVSLSRAEFAALRRLLEDQQTWVTAAQGTVEDLAARIAQCMPPRDSRTPEISYEAALTIARSLLEFAAEGLDSDLFQRVLLTRLRRMETAQSSKLDEALLHLHADLMTRLRVIHRTRMLCEVYFSLQRVPDEKMTCS